MSEHEQVNALLGTRDGAASGGDDYKSKYEDAMRQLQSAKVEQGRVAKLDAEKKALEKQLAELRENRTVESLAESLSEQERENLSPEFVGAAAKIAASATAGVNEELAKLRQEREEEKAQMRRRMEDDFMRAISAKYPEFLTNIQPGGIWNAAWTSFLRNNKGSVTEAFASLDAAGLSYHVDRFYRESLDVRPPTGGREEASTPDPVASRGGMSVFSANPDKVYTSEEYAALEKRAMKLRAQGKFEEYKRIDEELANILAEGRVKD